MYGVQLLPGGGYRIVRQVVLSREGLVGGTTGDTQWPQNQVGEWGYRCREEIGGSEYQRAHHADGANTHHQHAHRCAADTPGARKAGAAGSTTGSEKRPCDATEGNGEGAGATARRKEGTYGGSSENPPYPRNPLTTRALGMHVAPLEYKPGSLQGWIEEDRPAFPNSGTPPRPRTPPSTRAVVMHAALLRYKPGTMRRWIEEDNKGVTIVGIRWLLQEDRRGQEASSLVIYMRNPVKVKSLRMNSVRYKAMISNNSSAGFFFPFPTAKPVLFIKSGLFPVTHVQTLPSTLLSPVTHIGTPEFRPSS